MDKTNATTTAPETLEASAKQQAAPETKPENGSGKGKAAVGKKKRATASKAKPKGSNPTAKEPRARATGRATAASTLEEVCAAYVAGLEADGASNSTVTGYRAELSRALGALGADTPIADLTEDTVKRYFRSKRVTTKRDGEKRDQKTIDRTRRVLRLALRFAEEQGMVKKAPVPEKL